MITLSLITMDLKTTELNSERQYFARTIFSLSLSSELNFAVRRFIVPRDNANIFSTQYSPSERHPVDPGLLFWGTMFILRLRTKSCRAKMVLRDSVTIFSIYYCPSERNAIEPWFKVLRDSTIILRQSMPLRSHTQISCLISVLQTSLSPVSIRRAQCTILREWH